MIGPVLGAWGDFNEVWEPSDRNRGVRRLWNMELFSNFIDSCALKEVPVAGIRFTWSNFQERPCLSKLGSFSYPLSGIPSILFWKAKSSKKGLKCQCLEMSVRPK